MKNEAGSGNGNSDGKKADEGAEARTGTGGHRYLISVGLGIVLLAVVALTMRSAPPPDRSPRTVPHEAAARTAAMQIANADSPTDHEQDFHAEPPPADPQAADPNAVAEREQPSTTPRPRPTPFPEPPPGVSMEELYAEYQAAERSKYAAAKARLQEPEEQEADRRRKERVLEQRRLTQEARERESESPSPPRLSTPPPGAPISPMTMERNSLSPAQRKIDSKILYEIKLRRGHEFSPGYPDLMLSVPFDPYGNIPITIRANVTDRLLTRITELGGFVPQKFPRTEAMQEQIRKFPHFDQVTAFFPSEQIEALAADPEVRQIQFAFPPVFHMSTTSEGDAAHSADRARVDYGVGGMGVSIGVLSDGVNTLADRQASFDLPPLVTVLPGHAGSGDEGTAMLEIVHDLAPAAQLYFATGLGGEDILAQNVMDLAVAGCDVIVDDISYFVEPAFQDGMIAQAVDAVTAMGVAYFSAAGNDGNYDSITSGVWEGDFKPIAIPAAIGAAAGMSAHDWGSGSACNEILKDPMGAITLQWSDPQSGSDNNYDLYILDNAGTIVIDSAELPQSGTENPFEGILSPAPIDHENFQLVVVLVSGSGRFLRLNTHGGRLLHESEGQIWGHAAAEGAIAVSDTHVLNAPFDPMDEVRESVSDGPRRIFFDALGNPITPGNFLATGGELRNKPDITAVSGVKTSAVATVTPNPFNPFLGTSAAAPHAAAIAALLIEQGNATTPAAIRQALIDSAIDIEAPGPDRNSGYGIIDALDALRSTDPCAPDTLLRELERPAPAAGDQFGIAVAVSGRRAVVGAKTADPGGISDAGAAWVFDTETGAVIATLSNPAPAAGDQFGASVAISGNLAVVGADCG